MPYFYYIKFLHADGTMQEASGYAKDLRAAISKIESEGGIITYIDFES